MSNQNAQINLSTMTQEELLSRYKIFGQRGLALCGRMPDGRPVGAAVKQFFDELVTSVSDPEKIRQRNEFLARAMKDPEARRQLCAIRIETVSNYILATVNIMAAFFEIINLADDERPVIQNTTEQEIKVSFMGQDGGLKSTKVTKDDVEFLVPLKFLTTDAVNYKVTDIYRGSIVDAALKTLRMAYDMKNQMESICYALLNDPTNGAFGVFRYYGDGGSALKKVQYTYLPNSRINVANLPARNDITLPDNSGSTSFRIRCLRAAKKYVGQWAGAFPEGDLFLTGRIYIPGADAADIADEIVPSGSTRNKVADELLEKGWARINYLGTDFDLITDNTLTPGACFFETNRKPGRVYLKPGLDKEVTRGEGADQTYELSVKNEAERWQQKPFGAYINSAWRMNIVKVKYRN